MSKIKKVLLAFGAFFVLLMLLPLFLGIIAYTNRTPAEKAQHAKEIQDRAAAKKAKDEERRAEGEARMLPIRLCNAAQEAVSSQLKSPATAEFSSCTIPGVYFEWADGSGVYSIKGHVDSQNGFGAMIRSRYVVKMYSPDDKNFTIVRVSIEKD